jgi:hypothetical protein
MSPTLRLPKERLDALEPTEVETYLLSRGWKADQEASSPELGVYHFPADEGAEVLVPRHMGFIDYALRLSEVLQAAASVERRTAWQVLEDLLAARPAASPNGAPREREGRGTRPPGKGTKRNGP